MDIGSSNASLPSWSTTVFHGFL